MTKTELLSTYTVEQLAEVVVELQSGKGNKVFKVKDNKNYQKEIDEFFRNSIDKTCNDILEQKNNAMAMEFTRIICDLLKRYGVCVHCTEIRHQGITNNFIEEKYGIVFDSMDFSQHDKEFTDKIKELEEYTDSLKCSIERKQETIKQIDGIICELFGISHNGDLYTDEFKELLKEKSAIGKTITDFLPTEPIKVAEMLIDAEGKRDENSLTRIFGETYRIFDTSELRQIAEHLLVYCNHNGEAEEC